MVIMSLFRNDEYRGITSKGSVVVVSSAMMLHCIEDAIALHQDINLLLHPDYWFYYQSDKVEHASIGDASLEEVLAVNAAAWNKEENNTFLVTQKKGRLEVLIKGIETEKSLVYPNIAVLHCSLQALGYEVSAMRGWYIWVA